MFIGVGDLTLDVLCMVIIVLLATISFPAPLIANPPSHDLVEALLMWLLNLAGSGILFSNFIAPFNVLQMYFVITLVQYISLGTRSNTNVPSMWNWTFTLSVKRSL